MSRAAGAFLVLLLAGALPAAGDWVGERLCATGLLRDGEFGSAVAMGDHGKIAVGDYRHDMVYVFRRNAEGRCEQLTPIRGLAGDWFGFALASDGERLLIGAPRSGGPGAAFLYDLTKDPAERLATFTMPQARRGDEVGSSVAILRDGTMAIGARGTDGRRGRVYLSSGGPFEAVPVQGLAPNAELGQSVALSGTTLVMGAPSPYRASGSPGAAWVFTPGATEPVQLQPPGGLEPEAAFGYAVAVDRDHILVGAPLADQGGTDTGVVYSFRREGTGWTPGELQPLLVGGRGDQLGVAVALEGTTGVVGARYAEGNRGAAYLIGMSGGALLLRPRETVPAGAQLGFSVAIRERIVMVGAFREGGTGAAYRFEESVEEPKPTPKLLLPDGPLQTSEGGAVSLQVRLTGPPPEANITVSLVSTDPTAGTVSPDRLTFTSENWGSGKTIQVTVTGQDDALCDGSQSYQIRATTASADPRYNGLSGTVRATTADDELACLAVAERAVCTDDFGTVVYTIALANSVAGVPDATAELRDTLPPVVTVVTASADRGTATADPVANSVRWTGPVPAAITIVAALDDPPGPILENRALLTWDRDGRGHIEALPIGFEGVEVLPCPPVP